MTTRDLAWRAAGIALFGAACAIGQARGSTADGVGTLVGLVGFILAIAGVVLLVQGKRVPMAFRVERSGHRNLVGAIRARRRQRSGDERRAAR